MGRGRVFIESKEFSIRHARYRLGCGNKTVIISDFSSFYFQNRSDRNFTKVPLGSVINNKYLATVLNRKNNVQQKIWFNRGILAFSVLLGFILHNKNAG